MFWQRCDLKEMYPVKNFDDLILQLNQPVYSRLTQCNSKGYGGI